MSILEQDILNRLDALESEIQVLKSGRVALTPEVEFERLPDTATVGKEYVSYRFGCSMRAVVRREAGTHRIPRISHRPLKFIKRDVDRVWREQTKSVAIRAAEERGKKTRRRSILNNSGA